MLQDSPFSDMPNRQPDKVAILLGTYNGARFLGEQLKSFAAQSHANWHLYVSDDGSTDATLDMLEKFRAGHPGQVTIYAGPKKGFAENFLSLVCNNEIDADYFSYADQDDIWQADKIARAIAWHKSRNGDLPALYCSRSELIDTDGNLLGLSTAFAKPTGFPNALMQNVGAGNTMVFNRAACDMLRAAGTDINVAFHDWWTYIIVTGCGGEVFIDPVPSILYRQHGNNIIGANNGWGAKFTRLKKLLSGEMRNWNTRHIAALKKMTAYFTPQNRQVFDQFCAARDKGFLPRVMGIRRSGIYRQTAFGNLGLVIGAVLGKL